jgi:hypothetical protein
MAEGPRLLPAWILDLRPLVPLVSTLTTIATNPERWIRRNLGEFVVREVFDLGAWLIGIGLEGFGLVSGSLSTAGDSLLEALGPVGESIRGIPGLIYDPIYQLALSGGLAAPIASAVAVVFAGSLAVALIYVLVYAALSVIPGADGVRGGIEAWLN